MMLALALLVGLLLAAGVLKARARAARRDTPGYFSPEYKTYISSARWQRLRRIVLATTLGRDAVIPFLRASQVDHLRYRPFGTERIWFDLVPLHPLTHRVVTALRDAGLRPIVNVVLRTAYGAWFVTYACLVAFLAIAATGHTGSVLAAIRHIIAATAHH
jgi:hypothetical protein